MSRRAIGFEAFGVLGGAVMAVALGLTSCGSKGAANGQLGDDASTGAAGTGGGGGADGGAGVVGACGVPESPTNDTRDTATPYTAGSAVTACVNSDTDLDFYEFTAPAGDTAGGYYEVALDDVGVGAIDVSIYAASDNGEIIRAYQVDDGASARLFFAAAPAQKYRAAVKVFAGYSQPFAYKFSAKYTKIADAYEPNDTRAAAKPITVGTPIMAYAFSGFLSSNTDAKELLDFYSLTLAAGTVTVKASDVPMDLLADVYLYDADGAEVDHQYTVTGGASVTITKPVTAGMYYVSVGSFSTPPDTAKEGIALPDTFKHPYTLTVSQ
jgi:hypothetical protein